MLKKLIVINTRIAILNLHVRHVRIALKKNLLLMVQNNQGILTVWVEGNLW